MLSAIPPIAMRRPAKTSEYESTIHCSSTVVADNSLDSVGSATFTMVLSMTWANTHRQGKSVRELAKCKARDEGRMRRGDNQ